MPAGTGGTSDARQSPGSAEGTLAALSAVGCAVYRWDLATDAVHWGANADEVLGPGAACALSTGTAFLAACGLSELSPSRFALSERSTPPEGTDFEAIYRLHLGAGAESLWVFDQGRWFVDPSGAPSHVIGILHRMPGSAARGTAHGLDLLTELPTRRRLMTTLDALLSTENASPWALVLVGLDDLNHMNERFGFEVADQLILSLSRELRGLLRGDALLVRFSGSKFAILMKACAPDAITAFCRDLIEHIRRKPMNAGVIRIPVSVTIGALTGPRAGLDANRIISYLLEAHDQAKRRGRGRFFVDEGLRNYEGRRRLNLQMADEIVHAVERGKVSVALQPIVHAAERTLAFSEALARIPTESSHHPYSGHRLVAAAERLDLMGGLDQHMLHKVVAAMRRDPALKVSINVSASSIADDVWMRLFLQEVDEDIGVRLILELTESVAVGDVPAARAFIAEVRKTGARVAIDDFGAGASSFHNLRRLEVDILKIDGSYILKMADSPDDRVFTRTLLSLARQLGLKTVAEWVQNEDTASLLLEWGCDYFQGALCGLAQPLPEA